MKVGPSKNGVVKRALIGWRRQTSCHVAGWLVDTHEIEAPIGTDIHAVIGLIIQREGEWQCDEGIAVIDMVSRVGGPRKQLVVFCRLLRTVAYCSRTTRLQPRQPVRPVRDIREGLRGYRPNTGSCPRRPRQRRGTSTGRRPQVHQVAGSSATIEYVAYPDPGVDNDLDDVHGEVGQNDAQRSRTVPSRGSAARPR